MIIDIMQNIDGENLYIKESTLIIDGINTAGYIAQSEDGETIATAPTWDEITTKAEKIGFRF